MRRRSPILAVVLGVVLALGLVEAGFRLSGLRPPEPEGAASAEPAPPGEEGDWQLRRYRSELNSHRYHDYEWKLRKPSGTWRTVVLGDSFTEGKRVARDDLFTERIERDLNERADGKRRYEVLNVAHAGWGTTNQAEALEALLAARVRPDAVLLVYFINDATALESNPILVESLAAQEERARGPLQRWSRAWDWLDWRLGRDELTELTLADYRAAFEASDGADTPWRRSQAALAHIARLAEEHGFRFGVVLFPVLARLDEGHELTDLYDRVGQVCAELGVPFRSLLPAFLGHRAQELWVSPRNAHANARGHAIAAEAIRDFLIEENLVPLSLAVSATPVEARDE